VRSTNASSGDTQVTDVAANLAGTGPAGALAVGPASGRADDFDAERAGVAAAGLADPGAPGARTEPQPAMPITAAAASTPAQRISTTSWPLSTETPGRRFGWAV
jgi:hypothetical protein